MLLVVVGCWELGFEMLRLAFDCDWILGAWIWECVLLVVTRFWELAFWELGFGSLGEVGCWEREESCIRFICFLVGTS